MHALEVVVVGWGDCLGAVFAVDFHFVEHLSSSLGLYDQSHLCEFSCLVQLQVVDLVLLLRKYKLQLITWGQMLDVLPLQFQLIFACRHAIHYDQNLTAFCEIAFRQETWVHFLMFAYLERSLLSSSMNKKIDIQKGTFTDWSQV